MSVPSLRSPGESLRRMLRAALLAVAALSLANRAAADVGGDDVRIARVDGPAAHFWGDIDLGVTASGDLYAAGWGWTAPAGPRVYRSVDGGTHWSEWGAIDDWAAGHAAGLVAEGTPSRYVHARWSGDMLIDSADLSGSTAAWSTTFLGWAISSTPPSLACRIKSGAPADVYVTFAQDNSGPELLFARSTDGGVTFAPALVLAGPATYGQHEYRAKVVSDAGNRVRVVWSDLYKNAGVETLYYREATNGGASLADWASPAMVDSFTVSGYDPASLGFASSPASNDLLIAAADHPIAVEWPSLRLYFSGDGGSTWNHFDTVDNADDPHLIWGAAGPALGYKIASTWSDYYLARPSTTHVTSPWAGEAMLRAGSTTPAVAVAMDSTRGNQCSMVGWSSNWIDFGDSDDEMWFDAEWRAAPGYGVSEPGTPMNVGAEITSAPALADVDADGDLDVIFTRADSTLASIDVPTATLTSLGHVGPTSGASAPVVVDLEPAGPEDVFVGTDDGKVAGLDATGAPLPGWPVDLGTGQPVYTSAGTITGATRIEVVAASGRKVWVLRPDGTIAPGFPVQAPPAFGNVVGRVAVGDVDASGDQDLVAAYENAVVILGPHAAIERILFAGTPAVSAGVTLGDVDGDGDLEIAIPHANGSVGLLHHTGANFGAGWPFLSLAGAPIGPIAMANSRDTGAVPQLHFLNANGDTYFVDPDGGPFPVLPHPTAAGPTLREPVVQHLGPGNIANEMLVGTPAGYAHSWDVATAAETTGWRRDAWYGCNVACAAADLDGDGNVEAVIPAGQWLWVLDMGVAEAIPRRVWNQAGGSHRRDACWNCDWPTTTATDEGTARAATFALEAGPNPSRDAVSIRLVAPQPMHADVEILDVAGRLVRRVARDQAMDARGSLVWDGRDDAGRVTASGVYWARARVRTDQAERTMTRRITRIR
ncbi:MAG: hypothetical protein U0167_03050 [bacterium]